LYSSRAMYILVGRERVLGRVVAKISVGFAAGALILLAVSLYLSNRFLEDQLRLAETGDLRGATNKVEWAARLDPFSPAPLSSEGYLELRQGRPEAAANAFDRAIRRDPYNYKNHEALANLQRQQLDDPEAAVESYREALSRNPNAATLVSRLADALVATGDLEGARTQYKWLYERERIPLRDLYTLGKVQMRLGEPEEAIETFEEAKERAEAELESSDEQQEDQKRAFLESLDLATANALVVQRSYAEARDYLAQSEAEQAPAVLALLDEDPEAYRRSVFDASIN
jgi:tetratricopeptide (TPR) repeat protein